MLLSRILRSHGSPENPDTPLSGPAAWLVDFFGGRETEAGPRVSPATSVQSIAVYAAVKVLAESLASLPLKVFERLPRGKRPAPKHPLFKLLNAQPNERMTAFTFFETLVTHQTLWGNAYAVINLNGAGRPIELLPLMPDVTEPRLVNGRVIFETRINNEKLLLPQEAVLHVPALGWDGLKGISPISLARQAIGLGLAAEEFGARFFGSGSTVGGVLEYPGVLDDEAAKRVRESWNTVQQGLGRSHRIAVLEEGMKYNRIGIPPNDAQFLETRKFQITEIARLFRIPPHMLADLERATFSNVEQQAIGFVVHTMRPWLVRWEQELNRKLLTEEEQERFFVEFVVEGLLRGDTAARFASYQLAINNAIMTPNEVRERENLNPKRGGDSLLAPLNLAPLPSIAGGGPLIDEDRQLPRPGAEQRSIKDRLELRRIHRRTLRDGTGRIVSRETDRMRKALKRMNLKDFEGFVVDFEAKLRAFIVQTMRAPVAAYADATIREVSGELDTDQPVPGLEQFVDEYLTSLAIRHTTSSAGQIGQILRKAPPEEAAAAVEARLDQWDERRADKIADLEVVKEGGAMARFAYAALGVVLLRWVTIGRNCPLCDTFDGRIVGTEAPFGKNGEDVDGQGKTANLKLDRAILHPPLHEGCDCTLFPG